ncbi:MAG: DUF6497 family protein [Rhodobacteraceae bacterium]|nr:DUF6497 family protein [Paracoccaceae bacterium]MCF8514500.1 DUF6497 family protein [Paracoccaceae bacterium]MCF8518960.1 DUF6497 family protein [Paracoccaceae bacterium]
MLSRRMAGPCRPGTRPPPCLAPTRRAWGRPQQIVTPLSDRPALSDHPAPFGETMPEATQVFKAVSFADGTCIWEMF